MNFFGVGTGELLLILAIALLVLGPERLPEFVREATKAIRRLRAITDEITREINRELELDELLGTAPPERPPVRQRPASSGTATSTQRIAPPTAPQHEPAGTTAEASMPAADISQSKAVEEEEQEADEGPNSAETEQAPSAQTFEGTPGASDAGKSPPPPENAIAAEAQPPKQTDGLPANQPSVAQPTTAEAESNDG